MSLTSNVTTTDPSSTGSEIILELAYACAGTIADCDGSVLKVEVPAWVDYVGLSNSAHIASSSYDSGTREVTFTFVDPLAAGTTGTVRVRCEFPEGETPHNLLATFDSEFTSTSTVPTLESSSASVTSYALAKPSISKTLAGSAAVDEEATFKVEFCNAESNSSQVGALNFTNVRIEDQLPVGATFISGATEQSGVTTTYDVGTRIITTTIGDFPVGECIEMYYVVEYPSPTFSLGDALTNTAEVFYQPVGASLVSSFSSVNFVLENPTWSLQLNKYLSPGGSYRQGQFGTYVLEAKNAGSSPLTDFALIDSIPDDLIVQSILSGQWFEGPGVTSDDLVIEYQTNLNSSWAAMPPNPMSIGYSRRIYVEDLGLASNERLTVIRWSFDSYTTSFDFVGAARIFFKVSPTATVGSTVTNCLTYTTSSSGADPSADEVCESFTVTAAETVPVLDPNIFSISSSSLDVGDNGRLVASIVNEDITIASLTNFWGALILPKGFDVDPSTISLSYYYAFNIKPDPTITVTPNVGGTENTLVLVDWTGTGATLDPGENVRVNIYPTTTEEAHYGVNDLTWYTAGSEVSICDSGTPSEADVLDIDSDGDTAELLCYDNTTFGVLPRIETESELEVKGALDVSWTKYPATGESLPGGEADYRLSVTNTGNVALEDVVFIDILPHVGDLGVIDPQARLSEWSPNLAGSVEAPAGVVVYYSTEGNPCRAADGFLATDPIGCQAANWSSTPPLDITEVKSLKFDFGTTEIGPQSEVSFSWPMRTPVNVFSQPGVVAGDIAWNSFGYVANRTDNGNAILPAEPVKTGVALNALVPGVVGDFVWEDVDFDGIQDVGESGIDGVRVELYEDNGDGIADPLVDLLISFTVTADGGYYLFPNLTTGSYFMWFEKPPTYNFSPSTQGSDATLDSDATAFSKGGLAGAMTSVFLINDVDFEYSKDLGIYPSGNGAIGNYTWLDRNVDGVQNEAVKDGVNGIQVDLYTSVGAFVASTYSANNSGGLPGYFLLDDVSPGIYYLEFSHLASPVITSQDIGDDSLDSDPVVVTGRTATFAVVSSIVDQSWDCGFSSTSIEDCSNGVDDDLDGLIDCVDEECPGGNVVTRIGVD